MHHSEVWRYYHFILYIHFNFTLFQPFSTVELQLGQTWFAFLSFKSSFYSSHPYLFGDCVTFLPQFNMSHYLGIHLGTLPFTPSIHGVFDP